jgi:glycosyltransferase involved in cell wall biosynthesis
MNIAILTNFQDFNPGYSLTGIVLDQARMLARHCDTVHLFVCEKFSKSSEENLVDMFEAYTRENFNIYFHQIIPAGDLKDYTTMYNWSPEHQQLSAKTACVLLEAFKKYEIDVAFTHDWIFTGWNLPYAGAIRYASVLNNRVGWLHWVHSVPSAARDWWTLSSYGPAHNIVFPNNVDRNRVAEQFRTNQDRVTVIPHIKDPRVWFDFGQETWEFIDVFPKLLSADFIQVYPASTDRLSSKGIDRLINIFSVWKHKLKMEVCLVVANQWATGRQRKQDVEEYYQLAEGRGLVRNDEFIFTSELAEKYERGISSKILRELQLLSNVFIFPTREESFGLAGPEAALAGVMPVLNNSLTMMREVFQGAGLYYDFGSFHNQFEPGHGWDKYSEAVATQVAYQMANNQTIMAKTFCRKRYNMDHLYEKFYLPALSHMKKTASEYAINQEIIDQVKSEIARLGGVLPSL